MTRTTIIFVLIITALVSSSVGQKRSVFDPNGGEFQISGTNPKGFERFERMYLETNDPDGRRIRPNGGMEFGQTEYAMRNIVFDGRRWSFETVTIGGVRYRFDGRFPKLRFDEHGAVIGDNVLRGHLTKLVRGKRVAVADVIFSFVYYSD